MKNYRRSIVTLTMALAMLMTSPLMASGGGGGGGETEEESSNMLYITIGLAVVVGGLLIYDAITSDDETGASAASREPVVTDTGVDWESAFDESSGAAAIAVSVFPGEEGDTAAASFIGLLRELGGEEVQVYASPVDLGQGPPQQRAVLAREFFGSDYLVYAEALNDSMMTMGVASPDSVLWTSTCSNDNSIVVLVDALLSSGALD